MKGKLLLATLAGAVLGMLLLAGSAAADEPRAPMAKLCLGCHTPGPGMMMGFLDNVALKSKSIQMDFVDHKVVVQFTDATTLKHFNSFEDLKNYRNQCFQINYEEKDGVKIATGIIRFDTLGTLTEDEKLDRAALLRLLNNPKARVYDVRPLPLYNAGHIPGAMPMPAPAFDEYAKNLPEDKEAPIVFYGAGGCLSRTAAMKTKGLGYLNVKIFSGGYPEWTRYEYGMVEARWLQKEITEGNPQVVVDLRTPGEAATGHIQGAVNISLSELASARGRLPTRKEAPIVFYGPGKTAAATQALTWGFRMVRVLPVSFEGWQELGFQVADGPAPSRASYVPKPKPGTIGLPEFQRLTAQPSEQKVLIDVRNPEELADGMLPGAINLPLGEIAKLIRELPPEQEAILYSNTGIRAEMAHHILNQAGRRNRYLDADLSFDHGRLQIKEN